MRETDPFGSRRFQIGDAQISVISAGSFRADLTEWFEKPATGWPADFAADFTRPIEMPVLCFHVTIGDASIMIDACDPSAYNIEEEEQQPPSLADRLSALGIRPTDVTHVVVTHGHHDHFCGLASLETGDVLFPNAQHLLSSAEWIDGQLGPATTLGDGDAADDRILKLLRKNGLLEFFEGDTSLIQGVDLIACPGETPGHTAVHVCTGEESFFCLADLYHHRAELADPELSPVWADHADSQSSRQKIATLLKSGPCTAFCTHIFEPTHQSSSE